MTRDLESLGRLRLQAILLLLVIFVIGGLSGAAIERARHAHPPGPPHGELPPPLRDQLHLTAEQDQQVRDIMQRGRPRVEAVIQATRPRVQAVTDSIRAEVRAVLTPEQQKIFDRMEPPLGPPFERGPGHRGFGGPPGWDGPPPERGPR